MEIRIHGSFSEIQEVLRILTAGKTIEATLENFEPEQHHAAEKTDRKNDTVTKQKKNVTREFINCHLCGKPFQPTNNRQKFCGKQCYMIEWRELHKKPAKAQETDCAITPVAELISNERDKRLRERFEKIKTTCPAPAPRPDISRNLMP